jgi:hypothetical protein
MIRLPQQPAKEIIMMKGITKPVAVVVATGTFLAIHGSALNYEAKAPGTAAAFGATANSSGYATNFTFNTVTNKEITPPLRDRRQFA